MVNTHLKDGNEDCWLKEPAQNRVQLHVVFRWCCSYAVGYAVVCSYMRKLRLKPWNGTHMCMHFNTSKLGNFMFIQANITFNPCNLSVINVNIVSKTM